MITVVIFNMVSMWMTGIKFDNLVLYIGYLELGSWVYLLSLGWSKAFLKNWLVPFAIAKELLSTAAILESCNILMPIYVITLSSVGPFSIYVIGSINVMLKNRVIGINWSMISSKTALCGFIFGEPLRNLPMQILWLWIILVSLVLLTLLIDRKRYQEYHSTRFNPEIAIIWCADYGLVLVWGSGPVIFLYPIVLWTQTPCCISVQELSVAHFGLPGSSQFILKMLLMAEMLSVDWSISTVSIFAVSGIWLIFMKTNAR